MANEKISIDVEVETIKASTQIKNFARDTGKELDNVKLLKLELDLAGLRISKKQASKELTDFQKQFEQGLIKKDVLLEAQRGFDKLSSSTTEAQRRLQNYKNTGDESLSRLKVKFDGVNESIGKQGGLYSKLSGVLAGVFAIDKIRDFATRVVTLGANLEQTTIAFTGMLQSGEKAQKLLSDLTEFAKKTPFEIVGIRETAKQLLAFGFEQEKIIPTMKVLGDVAGGLSVPLEQIALAYGQVKTAGQLYGTELRQFVGAGVPLLQVLAKQFGVTEAEVKKMTENGLIGFKDVEKAFISMTSQGGIFADGMAKQSESTAGKWSNFKDKVTASLEQTGVALLPLINKFIEGFTVIFDYGSKSIIGLQLIFAGGLSLISQSFYTFLNIVTGVWVDIQGVFNQAVGILRDFGVNLGVFGRNAFVIFSDLANNTKIVFGNLAENIGIVFGNIGGYIGKGLDKASLVLNTWINSAIAGINTVGDKLGLGKIGTVNIKTNLGGNIQGLKGMGEGTKFSQLESFKNENRKIASERNSALLKELGDYQAHNNDLIKIQQDAFASFRDSKLKEIQVNKDFGKLEVEDEKKTINNIENLQNKLKGLKDKFNKAEIGSEAFKKLQGDIKATEKQLNSLNGNGGGGGGKTGGTGGTKKQAVDEAKIKEEALKKELERQKQALQSQALLQIQAINSSKRTELEKAKLIVEINKQLDLDIKKLTETKQEREVRQANEIIKKQEERAKKEGEYSKVAQELLTEGEKVLEDYKKGVEKVGEAFVKLKDEATANIKDINNSLAELNFNTDVKLGERRLAILEEEKKLAEELATLQAGEQTAETQKTIADDLARQLKLKEELVLIDKSGNADIIAGVEAQSKLSETEKILAEKEVSQAVLEEKKAINQAIVDGEIINLADIKNLKNIAFAEDLIAKRDKLNQDLIDVKTNFDNEMLLFRAKVAEKTKVEKEYTAFLQKEVALRVGEYQKLEIASRQALDLAQKAGLVQNTTNSTSVNQNINVSNQVDATSLLRDMNKTFQ